MENVFDNVLISTKLSPKIEKQLKDILSERESAVFIAISDINSNGRYGKTALIATRSSLIVYDSDKEQVEFEAKYTDCEKMITKRMYSNGVIRLTLKGKDSPIDIFRYTLSIAALCDGAALFVNNIIAGEPFEEQLATISAVYEKQLSFCPHCGRRLSSPGVQCINCQSKKKVLSRLAVYMKPELPTLIFSVFISIITTAIALLPPLLTKYLVDDILPNNDIVKLGYVCIFLVSLHVVRFVLAALRGYMLRKSGDKIVSALRSDVFEKAQHLKMSFYDKNSTGSIIQRISGDSATLQAFMLRISQEVIVQLFKMIGIIIIMLVLDPSLTLLSLIPVPIVVVFSRIFGKKIIPFYRRIWRKWTAITSLLTDTIPCVRVVKSFTAEKKATDKFKKRCYEWFRADSKAGLILNIYPATVNCLIACGSVVVWILGGSMVIDTQLSGAADGMSVGLLVSFISYVSMFYEPINFFATLNDSFQNALSSAERIFDILDAEPEADFGKGRTLPKIEGKIQFSNVSFSYDRSKKILKNINLTIEPGDIVGIVGTTGSGKSTLINLFMRYYDNYQGHIYLDGVDIQKIDREFFRSNIGFVQQEPQMFHDTIFNNISFGSDEYSAEEVMRAADIANAHEFIIRQPDGYDTVLGERGVGLSGGERQRLSIARAILRNPRILLFDEATASVDSETEHLIQGAIENLISGRTTIMIAHRLSTLSKANKIVVVDNGTIIECGTPEELLALKGKYYKLVQIQSMSDKVKKDKESEHFD